MDLLAVLVLAAAALSSSETGRRGCGLPGVRDGLQVFAHSEDGYYHCIPTVALGDSGVASTAAASPSTETLKTDDRLDRAGTIRTRGYRNAAILARDFGGTGDGRTDDSLAPLQPAAGIDHAQASRAIRGFSDCEAAVRSVCDAILFNFSKTSARYVSAAICTGCLQQHESTLAPVCGGPTLPGAAFFCRCTIAIEAACGAARNSSKQECNRCVVAKNATLSEPTTGCDTAVRWNDPFGRDGTLYCETGCEWEPGAPPPLPPGAVDSYRAYQDGYLTYRIPSLNTLSNGALLLIAEARKYSSDDMDHGWNDIVQKLSTDQGLSWGPMSLIHSESTPDKWVTIGNPAPVVLHTHPGTVVLVACRDNLMPILMRSTDNT